MMNINICLLCEIENIKIIPCIYELYYKNNRYVILNSNETNIITKSNPLIGWMQNCLLCDTYTFKLIKLDIDNNNKIYFYVCFKCHKTFNFYNFIIETLDLNIFDKHYINYKNIHQTANYKNIHQTAN